MGKSTVPSHHPRRTRTRRSIGNLAQGLGLAGLIMLGGIQAGISHGAEVAEQAEAEERSAEEVFRLVQDYKIGVATYQLVFAQARYRRDNQHFAQSLEVLAGDWLETTEHYQVELVVKGEAAFAIARPTHAALHSLIGITQATDTEWGEQTSVTVCRSLEPTDQIPPLEAATLDDDYSAPACPDGFARFAGSQGIVFLGAFNRAQQAYRIDHPQFASQIESLGVGIGEETDYHRFEIVLGEGTEDLQAVQLAVPKYDGIPTYMGIVMMLDTEDGYGTTTHILCRATESVDLDVVIPIRTAAAEPPTECPVPFERL